MADKDLPIPLRKDGLLDLPELHDLTPLTADQLEPWAKTAHLDPPLRTALRLIADGYPNAHAATMTGVSRFKVLRAAQRFSLAKPSKASIRDSWAEFTQIAVQELLQRLLEHPETFTNKDLTIGAGVGSDKLVNLAAKEEPKFLSQLQQLSSDLKAGESVTMSLTVEKHDADAGEESEGTAVTVLDMHAAPGTIQPDKQIQAPILPDRG